MTHAEASPGTVLVTGAARGIGRVTAQLLTSRGWTVVALDRDGEGVDRLTDEGAASAAIQGDLADEALIARLPELALTATGRFDALVNNAGLSTTAPLLEETVARIDETITVNLRAPILACQAAVRSFVARGVPGAIVNISSIHAQRSFTDWVTYGATKGGIEVLTRAVCAEFGASGVRCNAVAPGAVMTEIWERHLEDSPKAAAIEAAWRRLSPMHEILRPVDVAEAVAFLLSRAARNINGEVLRVDAGAAAWGQPLTDQGLAE
ncbi:MAG: hypothetical protein QOE87_4571 [Gaiellales bacterium]|jgi:NAD(P)-dependent dehydrogenase (short-subunit alcohol dehydrogenase family)|nr:hypothetical protein [Gaiellales bacterium]